MNILSTTNMNEKHQKRLSTHFPQHHFIYAADLEEGISALPAVEVLVTFGRDVHPSMLDRAPQLKWIHVMSAGVELLPFKKLKKRGIRVTNVRGIHAIPMAEYTFAVMLQKVRRTRDLAEAERHRQWAKRCRVEELWGRTIGIVGAGAIGKEIGRRAKAFGMRTLGTNTDGREVEGIDEIFAAADMKEMLKKSDFVVLTVPLTPSTRHMMDAEMLATMKESAYLINIARGSVVDESALIHALEEKRIAGAVLDVFEEEPLPKDHPFWTMDNVTVTPHISGLSPMYMRRAVELFKENLAYYSAGKTEKMKNVIDLSAGY